MKDTTEIWEKIEKVNQLLKDGETENITVDPYTKYKGYKPQCIVDAMNSVFGIGEWGFVELSNTFYDKGEDEKPKLAIAKVEVWLKGVEHRPVAYGQSNITRSAYGDAQKGAQTDAIKKALSYFSVGNRAYHGEL